MKVELAPEAVADLAALVEYLHQRNPQAAATTADGVFAVIDRLAASAFEGPECTFPIAVWAAGSRCAIETNPADYSTSFTSARRSTW